jgi:hypothetical protein
MLIKEELEKDMASDEHMDDMLTVSEVARLLHVHPNTLRRWSNKGKKTVRLPQMIARNGPCHHHLFQYHFLPETVPLSAQNSTNW